MFYVKDGGWHFTCIRTPEDLEKKLLNFAHHYEFEQSGLKINDIKKAINQGTKESTNIDIKTPLVHLSKAQIVSKALELNVPLEHTWSCYKNEDEACGICDSCRLRLNGFKIANATDPIKYKV